MTTSSLLSEPAEIGVIGGTGLYELFTDAAQFRVETPFGEPSDVLTVGTVSGRRVAFLPRHGPGHSLAPHRINYRANLWALRSAGVRRVLAPCAVGSLRRELGPGSVVVPDQVVDRTSGRTCTFYDEGGASHVSFADPYCADGRTAVLKAAADTEQPVVDGGTMVVVEGPRFSSRAESRWFASAGWSLVNMTGMPEAALARELALCYTPVALVTDLDAGIDADESVTQEDVYAVFARHIERLRALVLSAVDALPRERTCDCARALDGMALPFDLP
ncbi:S-methyl-5'-thioadenosine phosphorylase [Streptomyces sp. SID10853]|uniref:S-methyl-5'-thioadenosine phosphorylase n=1 Tax=Streptomyces sp. SID10853 TaxID=2706028 RepID=UPI0013C11481|nr:S-methyl-5'-thioadenosine phosphorylase [Streptomyces sp. SID10853]NDZ80839.1 S-methyl-5'-thioadenosine phosphorylase [Streptomyces sp. SID10853]